MINIKLNNGLYLFPLYVSDSFAVPIDTITIKYRDIIILHTIHYISCHQGNLRYVLFLSFVILKEKEEK